MAPLGRTLIHSTSAAVMIHGYLSLKTLPIDSIISKEFGGHLQYLTIQGLFIACATVLISLALDLCPSPAVETALKPLKRILLIISMPLEIVIASIYWPLLIFATQLILEKDGPPSSSSEVPQFVRIPLSMDLSLHAVPAITLLVDFLMFEKKYNRNELLYGAPAVSVGYTILYAWWAEYCASINGKCKFAYPFLTVNPLEIRLAIYAGAGFIALSSFWALNKLHA